MRQGQKLDESIAEHVNTLKQLARDSNFRASTANKNDSS